MTISTKQDPMGESSFESYKVRPSLDFTGGGASLILTFFAEIPAPDAKRWVSTRALREALSGEAAQKLTRPFDSYFADIVLPVFQETYLPVIMLAQPAVDAAHEQLEVTYEPTYVYEAEGETKRLILSDKPTTCKLDFREIIAIFPSGHISYTLALFSLGSRSDFNEYHIILLQKLIRSAELPFERRKVVRPDIKFNDEPLKNFLDRRRATFLEEASNSAFRQLIESGLVAKQNFPKFSPEDAKGGGTYIVNSKYFEQFVKKDIVFTDEQGSFKLFSGDDLQLDAIRDKQEETEKESQEHLPVSKVAPEQERILALLGIVQNILDFPWQGASEIQDSTEIVASDIREGGGGDPKEFLVFSSAQFLTEICRASRSFKQNLEMGGVDPYFFLSNLVLLYNEVLLVNAQRTLVKIEFGKENPRPSKTGLYKLIRVISDFVVPLFRGLVSLLRATMDHIGNALFHRKRGTPEGASGTRVESLGELRKFIDELEHAPRQTHISAVQVQQQDLDRFSSLDARIIPNIFKYPLERTIYKVVTERRGLSAAYQKISSISKQVEEITTNSLNVHRTQSAERTELALILIGLLAGLALVDPIAKVYTELFVPEYDKEKQHIVHQVALIVMGGGSIFILLYWTFRSFGYKLLNFLREFDARPDS